MLQVVCGVCVRTVELATTTDGGTRTCLFTLDDTAKTKSRTQLGTKKWLTMEL